jgi:hypothetical protein
MSPVFFCNVVLPLLSHPVPGDVPQHGHLAKWQAQPAPITRINRPGHASAFSLNLLLML